MNRGGIPMQAKQKPLRSLQSCRIQSRTTVSYTHLDVYKRQAQYILDHSTYSKNASELRKRFSEYNKTIREMYDQMTLTEKMILDVLVLELINIKKHQEVISYEKPNS